MLFNVDERQNEIFNNFKLLPIVFCQRDYWIENIFYDNGNIITIDWDTAGWGYLGEDIAQLIFDDINDECFDEYIDRLIPAYYKGFTELADITKEDIKNSKAAIRDFMLVVYGYRMAQRHMFSKNAEEKAQAEKNYKTFTNLNCKMNIYDYDNVLPINEYVDLSVVYGSKTMWVEFNGQYCYYTGKAPYLSLLENNDIPDELKDGLDFAIVCGENVELMIKSLTFTEYENDEPDIHNEIANMTEPSAFDWYIKSLPHDVRGEVIKTDEYLLKDLKASLKFKKSIDKDGKLTYHSPCGFRYSMNRYGIGESHAMSWHKNFNKVLNKLAETSPEFANRMFANIHQHISSRGGEKCQQCASITCTNMETIEYNNEIKRACGGTMHFKWLPFEFEDVRKVVAAVNEIVKITDEKNYESRK